MQTETPPGEKPTDSPRIDINRCDLSKLHLRALAVLAAADRPSGQTVRESLAQFYGSTLQKTRVYDTLNELHEWDLASKRPNPMDRRESCYGITEFGCEALADEVGWLVGHTPGLALTDEFETGSQFAAVTAAGDSA